MVNEKETERKRVADTDIGKEIQEEIDDLKLLLSAYKEGKINVDSFIYDVYDYLERFLESDIIVELEDKEENITKGMLENYELDKTYSFDKEVIKEKVEHITTGVVAADEINMIVNDKSVSAKNIIKELYEEYEGLSFDYLDGFMRYLNNLTMNPMLRRAN